MEFNRSIAYAAPIVSLKDTNDQDIYFALAKLKCSNLTNLYGIEVSLYGEPSAQPDITIIAFNNSNACNEYMTSLFAEGQFTWPDKLGTLNKTITPLEGSISNYVINKKTISAGDPDYPGWPAPFGIPGCYYNPNVVKPFNAGQIFGYTGADIQGYIHVLVLFSAEPSFAGEVPTQEIIDKDGNKVEAQQCDIAIVYGRQE